MGRLRGWRIPAAAALLLLALFYGAVSVFLANGITKADRKAFEHTPTEYSLPFEDVEFSTRGSEITLKGWFIPGIEGAPTLIFVHGLNSNRAGGEAVDLASRLRAQGFNTLLFDLRGHGTSADGTVSGGYFEQNDLLGAYDFLVNRGVPSENIGVIGFSMGAATSVLGVSQEPGIRALVADSPFANASDLIAQEVSRQTPVPKWLVPVFMPGTVLAADLLHDIKLGELSPETAVADIGYPILLIHGVEDTRIPVEQGIRVHEAAHPDSILWLAPDVDHVDAFLTYPEEYTNRVATYFQERLGAPGCQNRAALRGSSQRPKGASGSIGGAFLPPPKGGGISRPLSTRVSCRPLQGVVGLNKNNNYGSRHPEPVKGCAGHRQPPGS